MKFKNRSTYSDAFKKDGKSKYGDMPVVYRRCQPQEIKSDSQSDGKFRIEGYASTIAVDSFNEIITAEALRDALPEYLDRFQGLLYAMHDWWAFAIGKVETAEVSDVGLRVSGFISETTMGKDVIILIKDGIVKSFSIGFNAIAWEEDTESGIRTYTKIQLLEISVVNVPANPFTFFAATKNLKMFEPIITNNHEGQIKNEGDSHMTYIADPKLTELENRVTEIIGKTGSFATAMDTAQVRMDEMKDALASLHKMQNLSKEQVSKLQEGMITKDEFVTFAEKAKADLKAIADKIEAGKGGNKFLDGNRIAYKDWRGMLGVDGYGVLKDDNNRPLSPMHMKAYHYFQVPLDYKSAPDGEFIKRMRDCYDAVVLTNAFMKGRHMINDVQKLKSFHALHDMVEYLDPEFAKAMYSTGTALGDEWVPTLMSSELQDLFRLNPGLDNYIPQFTMPSNPYAWPMKVSGATSYLASEASSNNPAELHKSDFGTGAVTFTAKIHAVAIPVSPELIEDSIIDMVGEIRAEIAMALKEGREKALINGDTTATHADTQLVTAALTDDIQRAYVGLRHRAIADSKSWDTQSTSANAGDGATTFTAPDVRYCRQLLGKLGVNQRDCIYLTSITPYFYILSMTTFAKANEFGYASPWYTGELPVIDGCELYVSAHMPETLHTDGLLTAASSTNTHKGILCFNRRVGFKIGERRGVTVEFEKNIRTQQWTFVATRHEDFQKMQPSTMYPVSYGYNIE